MILHCQNFKVISYVNYNAFTITYILFSYLFFFLFQFILHLKNSFAEFTYFTKQVFLYLFHCNVIFLFYAIYKPMINSFNSFMQFIIYISMSIFQLYKTCVTFFSIIYGNFFRLINIKNCMLILFYCFISSMIAVYRMLKILQVKSIYIKINV